MNICDAAPSGTGPLNPAHALPVGLPLYDELKQAAPLKFSRPKPDLEKLKSNTHADGDARKQKPGPLCWKSMS